MVVVGRVFKPKWFWFCERNVLGIYRPGQWHNAKARKMSNPDKLDRSSKEDRNAIKLGHKEHDGIDLDLQYYLLLP